MELTYGQRISWLKSMSQRLKTARRYTRDGGKQYVTLVIPANTADTIAKVLDDLTKDVM